MNFLSSLSFNKTLAKCVAVFFSVWALYLRFVELAGREPWTDEKYQFKHTVGPFKNILLRNTYGDMTSFPGDYLLTYPFVQMFGLNKWGLMVPHLAATVLGFYFLFKLCERHFETVWGYVVAFAVVCFNQYLIFHSFELRPYAVLPTLALGSCYFADLIFDKNVRLSPLQTFGIGLFFIITILFHAFGIMIACLPIFYFFLARKSQDSFKNIFQESGAFFAAVFVVALPFWFWYAFGNPFQYDPSFMIPEHIRTFEGINNPLDNFGRFFNYVFFYYLIGYKRLYFLLGALLFLIFVPYDQKLKKFAFFLTLIVIPVQLILLSDMFHKYRFLRRQFIYLAPLLAFFLGWLWDSALSFYLDKNKRVWSPRTILSLFLMCGCLGAGITGLILYG